MCDVYKWYDTEFYRPEMRVEVGKGCQLVDGLHSVFCNCEPL